MKKLKIISSIIVLVFLFNACKKPADGATGPQGNTGSANVIYSAWTTSSTTSRDTTIDGTCLRIRHFSAPSLDTSVLNKGLIITYFRVGSIGPYQLPYISDAGGTTNEINCIYNIKKIFIYRHTFGSCRFTSASPGTEPVLINLPQSLEYRYVIVPGSIAGGRILQSDSKSYDINALKQMSYESLILNLGIPKDGSSEILR
jgi:hypothetical protein